MDLSLVFLPILLIQCDYNLKHIILSFDRGLVRNPSFEWTLGWWWFSTPETLVKNAKFTAQTVQTLLICSPVPCETPWKLFSSQYFSCDNLPDQNKANTLYFTAAYSA